MSEDWQWIGGACVITFLIWRGTVANKIGSAHVSSTSYREPDDDAEAIKPFESSHTAEDDLAAALIAYRSRAASAAGDAVRDVRQRHADAAEIVAKASGIPSFSKPRATREL